MIQDASTSIGSIVRVDEAQVLVYSHWPLPLSMHVAVNNSYQVNMRYQAIVCLKFYRLSFYGYLIGTLWLICWHFYINIVRTASRFMLPLLDLHCWFCAVILDSGWLEEHQPHFHTVQNQVLFMHSLIFISRWLILWEKFNSTNGFNILNCGHIWKFKYANKYILSSEFGGVVCFTFEPIIDTFLRTNC